MWYILRNRIQQQQIGLSLCLRTSNLSSQNYHHHQQTNIGFFSYSNFLSLRRRRVFTVWWISFTSSVIGLHNFSMIICSIIMWMGRIGERELHEKFRARTEKTLNQIRLEPSAQIILWKKLLNFSSNISSLFSHLLALDNILISFEFLNNPRRLCRRASSPVRNIDISSTQKKKRNSRRRANVSSEKRQRVEFQNFLILKFAYIKSMELVRESHS